MIVLEQKYWDRSAWGSHALSQVIKRLVAAFISLLILPQNFIEQESVNLECRETTVFPIVFIITFIKNNIFIKL